MMIAISMQFKDIKQWEMYVFPNLNDSFIRECVIKYQGKGTARSLEINYVL